ncbi:palindromic element RPE1 domain-containing protein [Candidatus Tisiphia endosymbiont of Dascillus cervinus]|uniref:palindromic element RPE1 domain-containing protein n=1 Tax=Candidatus Tisiphia endosymbiont of Dascillus cervinus TaxID=3066253 RepID=UPI00312C745E
MSDYILDIFDKLAYAEEFKEATESQPAADDDVREEQSTGSTNKLPAEVAAKNIIADNQRRIVRFKHTEFMGIKLISASS